MRRLIVLLFAAASGYVSLSQEMLWMRLVSYMTGSRPSVFAHVLGFFLIGIALGALYAERICQRSLADPAKSPLRVVGRMLLVSACFYYISITAVGGLLVRNVLIGTLAVYAVVAIVSLLLGGIFPLLCHSAACWGQSVGLAVSRIYLANIVGSTLGPLLTGFVLMEYLQTDRIILWLSIVTLLLGAAAIILDGGRIGISITAAVAIIAIIFIHPTVYRDLLSNFHAWQRPVSHYTFVKENRHGIIATTSHPSGDILYGGGVYDGMFTTDPVVDANKITRAYMIAGLHPDPQDVIEIGLATASWTRVVADYQPVRQLTVIEINPAYLEVIRKYPQQASVLTDPKVRIEIDDGRRWLKRHPEAKFDVLLQNTSWHWRSEATNLLSEEYFRLCKSHLKKGGVIFCNTTGCWDVVYTAARVFRHVTRFKDSVAASDEPFALTPAQIERNLMKFIVDGKPYFGTDDPRLRQVVRELSTADLTDIGPELRAARDRQCVTDDNMAVEYKQVKLFDKERTWGSVWRRISFGAKSTQPRR